MLKSTVEVRIITTTGWPFYQPKIETIVFEAVHKQRVITEQEVLHHLNIVLNKDIKPSQIAAIRQLNNPVRIKVKKADDVVRAIKKATKVK